MNDYTDFVIVAEEEFYTKSDVCIYNIVWEIYRNADGIDGVCCKNIVSEEESCLAEVVFVRSGVHKIRKKFKIGEIYKFKSASSIIIRILESKDKFLKQLEERWTADVNFIVNGEKCIADRHYLTGVSPVFKKMLFGDFAEAKQNDIPFQGCNSANVFKDFMLAISPFRIQPNPINVEALLQLGHQYDIPFLVRNCEEHLKHCYGVRVVDRIILAAKYNLNGLKARLGQILSNDDLKKVWKENRKELREAGIEYITDIAINRL